VRLESIGHNLLVTVRLKGVMMMHMCVIHQRLCYWQLVTLNAEVPVRSMLEAEVCLSFGSDI